MARRAASIDEYRRAPEQALPSVAVPRASVRILGIDPGSRYCGYGVIDTQGREVRLVCAGRIVATQGTIAERLRRIYEGLQAVLQAHPPHEIAVEETFVNRSNAQSALVLGQARGVALLVAAQSGGRVAEYSTAQVKLAVTGHGRSDKDGVQRMVKLLLKTREDFVSDAADALAVALCHAQVRGSVLASAGWKG